MDKEELHNQINELKTKLIETAAEKGRTHPETLEISKKLDELIIECLKK